MGLKPELTKYRKTQNNRFQSPKNLWKDCIQTCVCGDVFVCVCTAGGVTIQKSCAAFYPPPHHFVQPSVCSCSNLSLHHKSSQWKTQEGKGERQEWRTAEPLWGEGPIKRPLLPPAKCAQRWRWKGFKKKKKKSLYYSKDRFGFSNREAGCFSLREEGRFFGIQEPIKKKKPFLENAELILRASAVTQP